MNRAAIIFGLFLSASALHGAELKPVPADYAQWEYVSSPVPDEVLRNLDTLRLVRLGATFYAGHGCVFASPKMDKYFRQFGWYKPKPGAKTFELNEMEKQNAKKIDAYIEKRPERSSSVKVINREEVIKWLAYHFPDESSSWPEKSKEGLAPLIKKGYWDLVARGDFNMSGNPAALLIKLQAPVRSSSPLEKEFAGTVAKLRLVEYLDGKWKTQIFLGGELTVGGESAEKDVAGNKGYWIDLEDNDEDNADGVARLRIAGDLLTPKGTWAGEQVWRKHSGPRGSEPEKGKVEENGFRIPYDEGHYHYLKLGDYLHDPLGPPD